MGEAAKERLVGLKSRRGQRQPPCWLNRAGFEPFGRAACLQLGGFLGPNEPRGVVRSRRGSNPARIRLIWMVHHRRAEIFALPFADTLLAPDSWILAPLLELLPYLPTL